MGLQKITVGAASALLTLGSVMVVGVVSDDPGDRPLRLDQREELRTSRRPSDEGPPVGPRMGSLVESPAAEPEDPSRVAYTPAAAPGGAAPKDGDRGEGFVEVRVDSDAQALLPLAVRDTIERGVPGATGILELTSSRHAVQRVASGRADLALVCRDSDLRSSTDSIGSAQLGSWVPALVVHPENPVRNVPSRRLRDLLRGAVQDWSEIGGQPGPVRLIVPGDDDGRAAVARAFIPGDTLGAGIPAATEEDRIYKVLNDPFALTVVGISLARQHTAKVLTVDGVRPSGPARRRGTYPFGVDLFLVHGRNPDRGTRALIDRLLGDERERLIGSRLEKP